MGDDAVVMCARCENGVLLLQQLCDQRVEWVMQLCDQMGCVLSKRPPSKRTPACANIGPDHLPRVKLKGADEEDTVRALSLSQNFSATLLYFCLPCHVTVIKGEAELEH